MFGFILSSIDVAQNKKILQLGKNANVQSAKKPTSYKNVWPLKKQILIWIFRKYNNIAQNLEFKDGYWVYKKWTHRGSFKMEIA